MKQIIPPFSAVEALYRPGKAVFDNQRLTTHCLSVPCEDGILMFNTLTGALVLIENGETVGDCGKQLNQLGFFVDAAFDENRFSREIRTILGLTKSGGGIITSYTIFTTTDCNARCFYCYEKGIRRFTMSEKTAANTADFIIRSCGGRKVSLHWFGGEPLLNCGAINLICRRLGEAGISYSSKIITNGYFFDKQTVEDAKQLWRLKSAHIALDGTKDVYQRTKAYVNGDDQAFERVLDNIDHLILSGISVMIRLNIHRENYEDILCLCDDLGSRFGKRHGISVAPVLLRDYRNDGKAFGFDEIDGEYYSVIQDKLQAIGLLHTAVLEPKYRCTACMADTASCVVVYPDGKLGKCEHYNEKEIIGSIYDSAFDKEIIQSWKELKPDSPLCVDCPLYPQCALLKKCPNNSRECTPAVRKMRIDNMTRRVLKAYRDKKK